MKILRWHILFGIGYFLLEYFSDMILGNDMTLVKEFIFFITQNVYLFYGMLFVLRKFSFRSKRMLLFSVGRLVVIVGSYVALRYWVRYYFLATFFEKEYGELPFNMWITSSIIWIVNYTIFASAYFYFQSSLEKQKKLLEAKEEKAKGEQKRLALENAQLRAQINPHFLFNTLSFFHSQVRKVLPETGAGIIALSEIMRSAIRQPDQDGKVPLAEEVANIEHLVHIYQLRHSNKAFIEFTRESSFVGLHILPHILITLVENALKHGEIRDPHDPLKIDLCISREQMHFRVYNRKCMGVKDPSHGIGIPFLRSQLAFAYPNQFSLDITDDVLYYRTSLHIALQALLPHPLHPINTLHDPMPHPG